MRLLQLDTSLTSTKHKVMTRIRRLGLSKSTDITWRHQPFFDPLLVSKGKKGNFRRSIQSTRTWEVIEGIRDLTMVLPVITNATMLKQDAHKQLAGQSSLRVTGKDIEVS